MYPGSTIVSESLVYMYVFTVILSYGIIIATCKIAICIQGLQYHVYHKGPKVSNVYPGSTISPVPGVYAIIVIDQLANCHSAPLRYLVPLPGM